MKFKLDENLGKRGRNLFLMAGYEAATISEQGLTSASDRTVIAVCKQEERCLVTLDLDFSNPLMFQPSANHGIAVLRPPKKTSLEDLLSTVKVLLHAIKEKEIVGKLWIVEKGRIREYQEMEQS